MLSVNAFQTLSARITLAAVISIYLSKRGYTKKSLNLSGALSGFVVGFIITAVNYSFFACLYTFYITSSLLTKWKSERKRLLEEDFKEGGQRNAWQVLSNGGVAVIISIIYSIEVGWVERPIDFSKDLTASILMTSLIGSFACCNGDTWSSEIGTAIGSDTPRLITNLRKVPAGTNGGVTAVGVLASALGGAIIGAAFLISDYLLLKPSMLTATYPPQWPVILLASYSGLLGSIIDSLLGANFQYSGFCLIRKKVVKEHSSTTKYICGRDMMGNDQVNFLSSLITSLITPITAYYFWPH